VILVVRRSFMIAWGAWRVSSPNLSPRGCHTTTVLDGAIVDILRLAIYVGSYGPLAAVRAGTGRVFSRSTAFCVGKPRRAASPVLKPEDLDLLVATGPGRAKGFAASGWFLGASWGSRIVILEGHFLQQPRRSNENIRQWESGALGELHSESMLA